MFQKFITFAIIGIFNAILDTTIWKLLSSYFSRSNTIQSRLKSFNLNIYSGAQVFSFVIALGSSFYLNSKFTWRTNPLESKTRFVLYILVSIFAWIATVAYLNFFTKSAFLDKYNTLVAKIEDKYNLPQLIKKLIDYPLLVKISSIFVSMFINFFGYNYIVFR
jgi:putative flippase GtrA